MAERSKEPQRQKQYSMKIAAVMMTPTMKRVAKVAEGE
ncbi:hypothetical protein CCACVL1_29708 [Corchorus capsularis]|uniref:Uncharacterized protein n=1 Tax=Corchorus capsularis TaxID=210143 RepID=A0A1R3G0H4_COCAP|nr:hypothetical protein CCACVL1_29708 [Corchorus capsularis]